MRIKLREGNDLTSSRTSRIMEEEGHLSQTNDTSWVFNVQLSRKFSVQACDMDTLLWVAASILIVRVLSTQLTFPRAEHAESFWRSLVPSDLLLMSLGEPQGAMP
uniref:Uncharacterized protein n=1 Tax=Craspedostauros australis TaxID=1486917 RepID=A0A7R9WY05_9STRA|mmetsp:Transcript_3406/g.9036  ORF Transcript_3406/g.9036 Transcript_3406/m.9036 type:complete len:105 (+) Transcript_3406:89-403(+)